MFEFISLSFGGKWTPIRWTIWSTTLSQWRCQRTYKQHTLIEYKLVFVERNTIVEFNDWKVDILIFFRVFFYKFWAKKEIVISIPTMLWHQQPPPSSSPSKLFQMVNGQGWVFMSKPYLHSYIQSPTIYIYGLNAYPSEYYFHTQFFIIYSINTIYITNQH